MIRYAKLTRRFSFEAAHYLPFHDGKCKNMHGHTYILEVTIEGRYDKNGLIMDFHDFKLLVQEQVIRFLDHKCLNELEPFKHTSPTAENIALFIHEALAAAALPVKNIRLYETPDCWVDYTGGM